VRLSDAISVDEFHRFFTDKVEAVRAATAGVLPLTFTAALLPLRSPAFIKSLLMTFFPPSAGCQIRVASPTHSQHLSGSSLLI